MARRARPPKPSLREARTRSAAERCPIPPHFGHASMRRGPSAAGTGAGLLRAGGRGLAAAVRWVRAKPLQRAPLPLATALYGAGGLADLMDLPAAGIVPVTAGGALAAYATVARSHPEHAGKTGALVTASGLWLALAAELGPAAGPGGMLTWAYWTFATAAYGLYRMDAATRAAIAERRRRAEWHRLAAHFGIGGSHLLRVEPTRLGEQLLIDVQGTGRRASTITHSDLAERVAEYYKLPLTRVKVAPDKIAGRIRITIRLIDPWANKIRHPRLDPEAEITLPETGTVREPLVIGMDPETGRPLILPVWTSDGARHTMIIAMLGSGKTVLLNDILAELSTADDACIWGIDLRKGKDLRRWAPALDLLALPGERRKALRMLQLAVKIIAERAALNDNKVFQPGPGHPLIAIVIDEMSALFAGNDPMAQAIKEAAAAVATAGRSEGVELILVGQRGTIGQIGSTDIRTQIENIVMLRLSRRTEMAHVAGELGLELPDMARYGEGHKGVTLVADLDGSHTAGRTFCLDELDDITALAAERRSSALEPELLERIGPAYARLKDPATANAPIGGREASAAAAAVAAVASEAPASAVPGDLSESAGQPAAPPHQPYNPEGQDMDIEEDGQAARLAQAASSREQTRRYLAALPDLPVVDAQMAQRLAQAAEARRTQAAEQTEIAPNVLARLIELLARDGGTTVREVERALEAMGLSRMGAWRSLDRLRLDGFAELRGRGRGSRWHLIGYHPDRDPNTTSGTADGDAA
ncbi:hypothetical protein GCM10010156_64900 [Planobispora rosea]|uniref:FtsK domain-containing protein n=1 Tax=Planobispora rosea TaxID=35762 RepID=A0A8J3S8A3_PLARO|nr:hypothetical protein [Planobispora rosea]GGS97729.1 hypothetical protein GCM10010156_64900 [Planobispora rosea]GIH87831.1 hypothetical protein Pro02_62390 [Planobispora rosea]